MVIVPVRLVASRPVAVMDTDEAIASVPPLPASIVPWLVKVLGLMVIVPPARRPQLICWTGTPPGEHLDAVDLRVAGEHRS